MTIQRLVAQAIVTDAATAVRWYTTVFGAEPDARPMEGLIE